jgi:hypothetical protein
LKTTESTRRTKEGSVIEPSENPYKNIHYIVGRQEYCLTLPGGHVSFHPSLASAVRTQNSFNRGRLDAGKRLAERAAISHESLGYFQERETR